jgi:hypothetical protein
MVRVRVRARARARVRMRVWVRVRVWVTFAGYWLAARAVPRQYVHKIMNSMLQQLW